MDEILQIVFLITYCTLCPKSSATTESKIGYALLYKNETTHIFLYSKLVYSYDLMQVECIAYYYLGTIV